MPHFDIKIALVVLVIGGCTGQSASRPLDKAHTDSTPSVAPADTSWPDPTSHRKGYAYSGGVGIHYLDFGGRGDPLVFLTGMGSSAHIFDDLAPGFTDRHRVVAITRRGHAESDHPASGYSLDQLVDDVRAVLNTLGLTRVTLVGHSIAGGELTRFAVRYPDRVSGLIYLDAVLQPDGLARMGVEDTIRVKATEADFVSYESARAWFQRCFYGFWSPALEADFRINTTPPEPIDSVFRDASQNPRWQPEYSRVRSPALVLHTLATLEQRTPCVAKSADRGQARRGEAYLNEVFRPLQRAGVRRIQRELPGVRVVELKGHHFLFISNQREVVKEMRSFLAKLNKGHHLPSQ